MWNLNVDDDTQIDYPAACNAAETLLVHESLLDTLWPKVALALLDANVELECDTPTFTTLQKLTPPPTKLSTHVKLATPESYTTEHLSQIGRAHV